MEKVVDNVEEARRSLPAQMLYCSACLPAVTVAERIRMETTVVVLSLILGAQTRAEEAVTVMSAGIYDLDTGGPGLTLSAIHFFLLFQVNSRGLMLSKLLPKHERAFLTSLVLMSP